MIQHFVFKKDMPGKKIWVERGFNSPLAKVWAAWTESDLLDQWWAPRPWNARTKTMNFSPGGLWLYAMVSPEGDKHWSRVDFEAIETGKSFTSFSVFSDENGTVLPDNPSMTWHVVFSETSTGTMVNVELVFEKDADIQKIVAMGFEGGFTMGLQQLDELLATNN
jgi:uncharacterized protein YndB with AHSA1/START domain